MRSDNNQTDTTSSEYYAEKNNGLDVVFIGSSAIYRYIIPALIWKDTGITSYMVGSPAQPFSTVPALIENSERTLHPRLYVIEVRRLIVKDIEEKNSTKKGVFKENSNFNKTLNVTNVINQFVDNFIRQFNGNRLNNNDNKITDSLIPNSGYLYEGAMTVGSLKHKSEWNPLPYRNKKTPLRKDSEATLCQVLNLCTNEKLNVLFVSTTYVESKLNITEENYVANVINSYGYPYINLNYEYKNIGIDFSTDFYDSRHVNTLGAVKVTNYIAKYIKNNYTFIHDYTDSVKDNWENIYKTWTTLKHEQEKDIYSD